MSTSSRPVGVTIVGVLAWLNGAIQIATGVFTLIGGDLVQAIVAFVFGVVTVAVSLGIFRGRNSARILLAIVFGLNIAFALYAAFALGASIWSTVGLTAVPLLGILFLFSRRANAFFH